MTDIKLNITAFLESHKNWSISNNKLHREYKFKNFRQAFAFMTEIALFAEGSDHHPEWFNVYSTVIIDLTTHDAGGITEKDIRLATEMESVAQLRTA